MFNALQFLKRQPQQANVITKKSYSWVQVIVYLWAFRLGLCGLGVLIPGFSLMGMIFGNNSAKELLNRDLASSKSVNHINYEKLSSQLRNIRYNHSPVLISEVPILPAANVDFILKAILPKIVKSGKYSSKSDFVYFDHSKLWAKQHQLLNADIKNLNFNGDFDISSIWKSSSVCANDLDSSQCSFSEESFYYVSEPLENPIENPLLTTMVPSSSKFMLDNLKFEEFPPSVMLWLSSSGVRVRPHFDMEDNFLLQVVGTKTVILTHPSAYKLFCPHSGLHPLWRQSKFSNLTTAMEVNSAIKRRDNAQHAFNELPSRVPLNCSSIEITLQPGQMIYIPSFYFHSTISEENSVSINIWFRSLASKVRSKLSKVVMPFLPQESTGGKLASLGASVRLILYKLQEPLEEFLDDMRSRYESVICDENDAEAEARSPMKISCLKNFKESTQHSNLCSPLHHTIGDSSATMRRHAMSVYSHLNGDPLSPAIRKLILMDYLEDIVEAVLGPLEDPAMTSPCAFINFVDSCIVRSE